MDHVIYFSRRAAEEIELARRGATTAAVRAHYQLSELYLDEIERLEGRAGVSGRGAAAGGWSGP